MKSGFVASLLFSAAMLAGCSGIKTPTADLASHDSRHDIPAIDQMIVDMKQDYIQACYMPVAKREPGHGQQRPLLQGCEFQDY